MINTLDTDKCRAEERPRWKGAVPAKRLFVRPFQAVRPGAAGYKQYPSRGNYSSKEKGSEENGPNGFSKLKRCCVACVWVIAWNRDFFVEVDFDCFHAHTRKLQWLFYRISIALVLRNLNNARVGVAQLNLIEWNEI